MPTPIVDPSCCQHPTTASVHRAWCRCCVGLKKAFALSPPFLILVLEGLHKSLPTCADSTDPAARLFGGQRRGAPSATPQSCVKSEITRGEVDHSPAPTYVLPLPIRGGVVFHVLQCSPQLLHSSLAHCTRPCDWWDHVFTLCHAALQWECRLACFSLRSACGHIFKGFRVAVTHSHCE